MAVPDVLLGGDHGAIADWRQEQSRQRSRANDEINPSGKDGLT
jgi:tRNA G37 N-methylase TrmD